MGVAGKVVGFGLGAFVLGVLGCAAREFIAEYDKNVDDYNRLVDDCDRLNRFIREHDFYERPPENRHAAGRNVPLEKVDEFMSDSGQSVKVFADSSSGFKVYEFGKRKDA